MKTFLSLILAFSLIFMGSVSTVFSEGNSSNEDQQSSIITSESPEDISSDEILEQKVQVTGENGSEQSGSAGYFSVYLKPSKGKKTIQIGVAKVSILGNISSVKCDIKGYTSTSRNGTFTKVFDEDFRLTKSPNEAKKIKLKTTNFWNVSYDCTAMVDGQIRHYDGDETYLINKMGREYPHHKNSTTNTVIPEPNVTTWAKVSATALENARRTYNNGRNTYRTYWEINLNGGKAPNKGLFGGYSWDGYDIHHIIPLEFGGSNNYSNYVVLNKSDHQDYTTFFKGYWGTNK